MSTDNQRSKFAQPAEVGDTKKGSMRLEPQVLLKHQHGVTMQWWNEESNYLVIAIYRPTTSGKYALAHVAGPWSGVEKVVESSPETWRPCINPGFDDERAFALDKADQILTCLNADYGGMRALQSVFDGPILGFDELVQN